MNTMLDALLIGAVKPLADTLHQSGIDKSPVSTAIWASINGLSGDGQGDLRRHGGPEKALHHYAFEHYDFWRKKIGNHPVLLAPGAFGENLSSIGMTEQNVCIGDIYELGEATVQVTQARQPCWKLNHRFQQADMSSLVQQTLLTGWYYRVLKEGWIAAGCEIKLVEREYQEWSLARILNLLYKQVMHTDELREAARIRNLPDSWRMLFEKRIRTQQVEDWNPRLKGKDGL